MTTHPMAGKPPTREMLIDVAKLRAQYYDERPDPADPAERVAFGTSGHRGSAARRSFNEAHVLAIAQAVCEYRSGRGYDGPLFVGMDTHALSEPAQRSVLEVLAGNGVELRHADGGAATPTPLVSHAILVHNRGRATGLSDGIVITPSHNPPEDGGIKYNPPHGGPAEAEATSWIEARANELLAGANTGVRRVTYERALTQATTRSYDFVRPYVGDLSNVLDMDVVRAGSAVLGVDPMGGASLACWQAVAETYQLNLTILNDRVDPTFSFMPLDHDGKIRMDCSSRYAMANVIAVRDRFDIAFGNDADADRHGIVTPAGLLDPNRYLAVAIDYLFTHRPAWSAGAGVGKTIVSSSLIDRVVASLGRRLVEVPVGFKWFVDGLLSGAIAFGGEESAGASFVRRDGSVWTTDKDGILLDLLAAEILVRSGKRPDEYHRELVARHGESWYVRVDRPATPELKRAFKGISGDSFGASALAGEPVTQRLTHAPGNGAAIGGIKLVTAGGWIAVRPSGTENIYKLYAESFRDQAHLERLVADGEAVVATILEAR